MEKSNKKLKKVIEVGSYLIVWAAAIMSFWFFVEDTDAMGYALMIFYFALPITSFVVSLIIGKDKGWGKEKWFMTVFFGIMYMLAEYATFSLANMTAFDKINIPDFEMIIPGVVISLVGLIIGIGIRTIKKK
ncbi:MAG: hypothetical protein E7254_10205 [Lachnospiraceae bacterium]|nr:hypothetical protein [Lachnospiraceae bacterium]